MAGPAVALFAAGTLIKSYGQAKNAEAEAAQERANAAWYREQAAFAQEAGERQRMLFDRESQVLYGQQQSGFAKAGIDTGSSSEFMAREMLYRDQESYAIKREADMNVKLAMMRANAAEEAASQIEGSMGMNFVGNLFSAGASYYGNGG